MADAPKLGFASFGPPKGVRKGAPKTDVLVAFCDDGLRLGPATRQALRGAGDLIERAAKADRFTGKSGSALDIVAPAGLKVARLVVIGTGKKDLRTGHKNLDAGHKDMQSQDLVKLGGAAAGRIPSGAADATILAELPGGAMKPEAAADLALGAMLRLYAFDRYKTKRKEGEEPPKRRAVTLAVGDVARTRKAWSRGEAVASGVLLARDLVNEPANVLYPEEFARRAAKLRKLRRQRRRARRCGDEEARHACAARRRPGLGAAKPRRRDALEGRQDRRRSASPSSARASASTPAASRSSRRPAWRT